MVVIESQMLKKTIGWLVLIKYYNHNCNFKIRTVVNK